MGRRLLDWLAVALLAACMAMLLAMQAGIDRFLTGKNDFAALYAGASLSGTPGLYDAQANKTIQKQVLGAVQPAVVYTRPPYYAFLLRPLGKLPYAGAYLIFQLASLTAFAISVWILGGSSREFVTFAVVSVPALLQFMMGQDVTFVLLGIALSLAAFRGGWPFIAGLALSLCAAKPHLVVLIPVVWAAQRQWRAIAGGIAGGTVLMGIAFLSDGPSWPARYVEVLGQASVHPNTQLMPTVRGMFYSFFGEGSAVLTVLLCMAVAGVVGYIGFRQTLPRATAVAALGGVLISYHAYIQDCVLGLALLGVIVAESPTRTARLVSALAFAPPVYFAGLIGTPWSALIPAVYLVIVVYCAFFWPKQASVLDPGRRHAVSGAPTPQTAFSKLTGGL